MRHGPDITRIAALIGDPARGAMLSALIDGQALTARELADEAGITPQTASGHLAKLCDGGLLIRRQQGRHRYFALAGPQVAEVLEGLMGLSHATGTRRTRPGPRDPAMRAARVCYNHLAGAAGITLFRSMADRGFLVIGAEGLGLSDRGAAHVTGLGVQLDELKAGRTPLCRECLDWSERQSHLGGALGRALFARMEGLKWIRRDRDSRAVLFSPEGRAAFRAAFPAV